MKQIIEKEYDKGLEGKIIYIGLAHCDKEVEIKWVEKTGMLIKINNYVPVFYL